MSSDPTNCHQGHKLRPLPTGPAFAAIAISVVLFLGAVLELTPQLSPPGWLTALLWFALGTLGVLAGARTIEHARAADLWRWQTVQDDTLTSGERQMAHREADARKRSGGALMLLGASAPAVWLAYQFRQVDTISPSDLLILAPVLGFGLGLFLANNKIPPVEPQL